MDSDFTMVTESLSFGSGVLCWSPWVEYDCEYPRGLLCAWHSFESIGISYVTWHDNSTSSWEVCFPGIFMMPLHEEHVLDDFLGKYPEKLYLNLPEAAQNCLQSAATKLLDARSQLSELDEALKNKKEARYWYHKYSCLCKCVYMYMYIYTCIYTHVYIYIYSYIYMYLQLWKFELYVWCNTD